MARSPLTETINRVQGMITYVRENLSTDEYMLYLDLLVPEPGVAVKTPVKRKRKPRAARSPRAESLATAIGGAVGQSRATSEPLCASCGNVEDYEDHAQPSPHYHVFEAPAAKASVAAGD